MAPQEQSSIGAPTQKEVTVAVLPPRLPAGMAPPTGIGAADAFSWDESINWTHNQPIASEGEAEKKKSFCQKMGLTTAREKANPDAPPFVMRTVTYETWRKHYAKDKDGNYQGTHVPAEDCLLKPHDVEKWSCGDKTTMADTWTRGKIALPAYDEEYTEPQGKEGDDAPVENFKPPKKTWKQYVQKGVEMASMGQ